MGVKLQELIIRKKVECSQLKGKIIAIDAPNIIFQLFNYAFKSKDGKPTHLMTDRTQRVISHLYGILYRINFYYSKKFFPIFCFDGRDSELKRIITKDQLNDFRFTKEMYERAIRSAKLDVARQIAMGKEFFWPNIISESKKLLGALGVPFIESPASAESQCAHLVKEKKAHYSNSQDFDSLLFGCPYLIQNLSKSLRRKQQGRWTYTKIEPLIVNLHENLKRLNINQFQLVDMVILIGNDYFRGIKGIGPKTALGLIKKYQNLENVISNEKKNYDFHDISSGVIKKVRKIFLFPEVLDYNIDVYWNPPNESKVIELLCEDHNLNKDRVKNNLNKLMDNYHECRIFFKTNSKNPTSIQQSLDMFT
jgi:flap endonuclease-1